MSALRSSVRSAALCCGSALVPIFVASCNRSNVHAAEPAIQLTVAPDPPSVGPTTFTLALSDAGGAPIHGAKLSLEATMSHAGMVPVFADPTEREPGVYVAELELTMGGDWILIVEGELAQGGELHRELEVRGVGWKRGS